MERIIKYRSNDGIEFETEEACLTHENHIISMINAAKLLYRECEHFSCCDEECKGCPFVTDDLNCKLNAFPFEWSF